ncbi:MAG: hypothetical protein HY060_06910 [Proteobacteria bacterium]|nr:hypothetical protein [Pseudomonadota bacterium]
MTVEYIWVQQENGATMMRAQPQPDPNGLFGEEGMTFKDALDIINPLQQLPIIGSIYRELTGDTIKPGARLIGGAIYGLGVVGIVTAALSNAVEYETGKDIGGTAIAMIKGESLEQMQLAQTAKRGGSNQVASIQYYSGGADPIDPTSLPAGAQMVDYPAGPAARNMTQYAALPTDQAPAQAATAAAGETPAAAPAAAVSVTPLPPTINSMGAAAGEPGSIPTVPSAAGLIGLTGSSRLPSAGSITPAAAALTAANAEANITAGAVNGAAASTGVQATTAAAKAASDGFFPVPARTNNVVPRMPIALNPTNVGTQPLALSNPERRTLDAVTVSAPVTPSATAEATTPMVPTSQVPEAMMRALDKYDALMKNRRGGTQVDRAL